MRAALFLVILFTSLCKTLLAGPLAVYLTWQKDPTTTMTIQWISAKSAQGGLVEYQEVGSPHWISCMSVSRDMPQHMPYKIHTVELQNLKPNAKYSFRLEPNGKVRLFRTMPTTLVKPITFVVGGDTNHDGVDTFKDTNRIAAKQDPYFCVLGGDLAYACPKDEDADEKGDKWLSWIQAYSDTMVTRERFLIPLLVTLGNHDITGRWDQKPKNARFFFSLFAMPGLPGYNVLRFSNYLSLYLLDSSHANPVEGVQSRFLASQLEKDQKMLNRFAVYHVPAYPSKRSFTSEPTATIRKHWLPIFDKYNLHAAFENHDHNYKRTYPLRGGKVHPQGVVYIGDGSWGASSDTKAKNPQKEFIANFRSVRQFLKVELSERQRKFSAIDSKERVIDQYIQEVK